MPLKTGRPAHRWKNDLEGALPFLIMLRIVVAHFATVKLVPVSKTLTYVSLIVQSLICDVFSFEAGYASDEGDLGLSTKKDSATIIS